LSNTIVVNFISNVCVLLSLAIALGLKIYLPIA
jgi:hypothetical protein